MTMADATDRNGSDTLDRRAFLATAAGAREEDCRLGMHGLKDYRAARVCQRLVYDIT